MNYLPTSAQAFLEKYCCVHNVRQPLVVHVHVSLRQYAPFGWLILRAVLYDDDDDDFQPFLHTSKSYKPNNVILQEGNKMITDKSK